MKTKANTGGFTSIELLVVAVVIAMLAALMLSSLATSKTGAQGAMCLSNLKQLTTAWAVYTGDNRGKLVPNGSEVNQPSNPTDPSGMPGGPNAQWCPGRQDLVGDLSPPTSPINIGYEWIQLGLIYPYVGNVAAYHCPADTGNISAFGTRFPHVRSVSMNTWLGALSPYDHGIAVESYYKDSDLVRPGPAQLFVFIDENPLMINDGSFICEPGVQGGGEWIDCPASYHNGGSGMSFADGHVEIKRWTDQTVLTGFTSPTILPGNPDFVRLAPQQNPPRDLTFLQNASTYVK